MSVQEELNAIRKEYDIICSHHVNYNELIDAGKIKEATDYYKTNMLNKWLTPYHSALAETAYNFSGKFCNKHPFDDIVVVDGAIKPEPSDYWVKPPTDLYILCEQVSNEIKKRLAA